MPKYSFYLSQTKNLVDGARFFIYTKAFNYENVFFCNLCGIDDIIGYKNLKMHDCSILHTELSKLEKIPYKSWMKSCLLCDEIDVVDANESLKKLISSIYGKNQENIEEKPSKKKIPRGYRHFQNTDDSSSDSDSGKDLSRLISIERADRNRKSINSHEREQKDEPTFLSMFRQLTSLEDFLNDNIKKRVKDLFLKSIELERKAIGSSNSLLSRKTLDLLFCIERCLSAHLPSMPEKFLNVVSVFYDDMLHFTNQYETSCKNAKKIRKMKAALLSNH